VSDGDWERALVGGLVDRENGQLREGATMAWRMNDRPDGLGKLFPESRLRVFVGQTANAGCAVLLCN
jgi:hypothetical protein